MDEVDKPVSSQPEQDLSPAGSIYNMTVCTNTATGGGGGMDLRQEIMRVNNNVNISIFGTGLRKQRVAVSDDKIIITADHKRVPALAALDKVERATTRYTDVAILDEFKRRLRTALLEQLKIPVQSVMKDYDPEQELAVTVIIVDEAFLRKHQEVAR
jgi:hypothetical protein